MLPFSFHLSKHHCDFLSSFLYTQSISQVIFPFKSSRDLLIRSLMTRKACKTDQFRAVYLNHWKILRLCGVCFYIFSSLLGLERSPSLGFVHDCWRHVPHSFSHPAWWSQCMTLVLVGFSCLMLASSGCPTALIKLQGKAQPTL